MISGELRLRITRSQRIGWAMQTLAPTRTMQSDSFEILVGVRRGVESERLFVGHDGRGHALPCIAVAVNDSHAELGERSEQGHFLGGDLARAQEGDGSIAVDRLDISQLRGHGRQRGVPVHPRQLAIRAPQSSGALARSGASRTLKASQPLGQAMPRFTGCSVVGVRLTASPSRR